MDFTDQRLSYDKNSLSEDSVHHNPFSLLKSWLSDAIESKSPEPYAMSLATCGEDNLPSVRIVLLREVTETGLVFYTNYLSEKAEDIAQNPNAEVLFFWHDMERQIRIRGKVARISRDKTIDYFHKRPHDSQVGAWVSEPQSGVVASREVMENKFAELKATYPEDCTVPTPDFWGGYELTAECFEFWQGRANRMHDRIRYQQIEKNSLSNNNANNGTLWQIERLLP